jgi:hypothetical protein
MKNVRARRLWLTSLICFGAWSAFAQVASAAVQSVNYGNLIASATVATPLDVGDTLFLNTFTAELGALDEKTTFTVGPNVGSFVGRAAWEVGGPPEPNLSGVNIKIFNASNTVVADDNFAGVLAGFAHSTFGPGASLAPGTYTLEATGTGNRASSLDISLTFAQAIPEPATIAMLVAGIGLLGWMRLRKSENFG